MLEYMYDVDEKSIVVIMLLVLKSVCSSLVQSISYELNIELKIWFINQYIVHKIYIYLFVVIVHVH